MKINKKKKFIISGIGPGIHGLGRLVSSIISILNFDDWDIIYKSHPLSYHSLFFSRRYFKLCKQLLFDFSYNLFFYLRILFISKSTLVILHPQSIGYSSFLKLVKKNDVWLYVVDNGFFCIKSYNHVSGEYRECLRCFHSIENCLPECIPFPIKYNKTKNLSYLRDFRENVDRINFLTQTEHQSKLIKNYFNDQNIKIKNIGLYLKEFDIYSTSKNKKLNYDIVFHASLNEAKGLRYLLDLAKYLRDLKIMIPFSKKRVENILKFEIESNNLFFLDTTWETGLQEDVISAKMIICPSLWSCTIEGALLKSIIYNGKVAVFKTNYGFPNEIPQNFIITLDENLGDSAKTIMRNIEHNLVDVEGAKLWAAEMLANSKIKLEGFINEVGN